MNITRGVRVLTVLLVPALALLGCESASSGHAPGVAGGQTTSAGITNYPLAYVKKPVLGTPGTTGLPVDVDARDLITSITGGDLYVNPQASSAGPETNVTFAITQGKGDVRDLDVSPDGSKLVFSLRLPLDPKLANTDPKQPNWHIYQYDAVAKTVTQLTNDAVTAGHDVGAHYLPDGRIVFASTRQTATRKIQLDEGRPQYPAQTDNRKSPIFLLHVMNADGTGIHQISFNTNHDFAPSVLNDGRIVFSRWEVTNGVDQISLYRVNPDGTGLELYYGANSHATGANVLGTNDNVIQFLNARQRPDGRLLAIARPFAGTQLGGDTVLIDAGDCVEFEQSATPTGPACGTAPATSATVTSQTPATLLGITTDVNTPSLGGRFYSAYPLYDGTNRMLVSWVPCLIQNVNATPATVSVCTNANTSGPTVQQAPAQYTVWIYDFAAGTLSPVLSAQAGIMVVEPVVLQKRAPTPAYVPDFTPTTAAEQGLVAAGVGVLEISSVYDFDGLDTADPNITGIRDPGAPTFYARPYRFIRLVHPVEIPDKTVRRIDPSAFGPAGLGMREILGYAPIQPDGSVRIDVPANVPFTIELLDANAQRVTTARHTSWLQVMPGETKSCNGCHSTAGGTSHGRAGLTVPVNPGAPTTGQPFPNTNTALFANAGETMAATLARVSCTNGSTLACSQNPSSDVVYTNVWTRGVTLPAGKIDAGISLLYSDLNSPTPLATPANCSPTWTARCRATPHYPLQIEPVWNVLRTPFTVGAATVDPTCVACHTSVGANAIQVPAGQLDLTATASTVDATVVVSYEQLMFPHNEQTLIMGVLEDVGPPAVPVTPAMTAGSAVGSSIFFNMFNGLDAAFNGGGAGYIDHTSTGTGTRFLTPAELRLTSEWLDLGGQYYNDPFVAPAAN
jgi:mono/diheme cytochrome c family protein